MVTIGIDLGGNRLRVAIDRGQGPTMVAHQLSGERMPRLVSAGRGEDSAAGYRIVSLKRMLDFDLQLPVASGMVSSLDYLAAFFRIVQEECQVDPAAEEVRCVLSVPMAFSQRQRLALRTTAVRSGFNRVRLVDDPLAVLLACRDVLSGRDSLLVCSWGATAFSASLYCRRDGSFRLVGQEGDRDLGGDDIDSVILTYVLSRLSPGGRTELPVREPEFLKQMLVESEKAKLLLASGKSVTIRLSGSALPDGRDVPVPKEVYEQAVAGMVARAFELVDKVLAGGDRSAPAVVLVSGGTTLLPEVGKVLRERFGQSVHQADEQAVAVGAIRHGQSLRPEDWEKVEEVPADRFGARPVAPLSRGQSPAGRGGEPAGTWAGNFVPLLDEAERLEKEGRPADALRVFRRLMEGLTDFHGMLSRRAASACQAAGQTEQALDILAEANRLDPDNRLLTVDLARARYHQANQRRADGQGAAALQTADLALAAMTALPNVQEAYPALLAQLMHLKACLLCDLGRLDEAERLVGESVRLAPDQEVYRQDLDRIREALKVAVRPARQVKSLAPAGRGTRPGPNDFCPCGSRKKYKRCCGR